MAFCCDKLSLYTTNTKKFRVDYYETREREREREFVRNHVSNGRGLVNLMKT